MKLVPLIIFAGTSLCGTRVIAEPCVSNGFDLPVPGATEVVVHYADVPSARFPAYWQTGLLDGFAYVIRADGSGEVTASAGDSEWSVQIICALEGANCDQNTGGDVPAQAKIVADQLSQCLLGQETTATVSAAPSVEETIEPVNAPCGLAQLPDLSKERQLQSLLLQLGADPGPVDGIIGPWTMEALDSVWPDRTDPFSIDMAIDYLDGLACAEG